MLAGTVALPPAGERGKSAVNVTRGLIVAWPWAGFIVDISETAFS
jgi:hypothetical protein